MTVTAYYPDVFVKDLEAALAEFESIGFKLIRTVENEIIMEPKTEGSDLVAILEKDNKYHVSLHGPSGNTERKL